MGIIAPKKVKSRSKIFIAFLLVLLAPVLLLPILLYLLWGAILYIAIWLTQRKPFVIFVYSDSPTWKEYIEKEILHHIRNRAVILNWSERRHWKNSWAVLAFRYFGGQRNFNPMGMVFRPFRFVRTYRFFEAFKAFKHGHTNRAEDLKRDLLDELNR